LKKIEREMKADKRRLEENRIGNNRDKWAIKIKNLEDDPLFGVDS
jgi:hypothetical protein